MCRGDKAMKKLKDEVEKLNNDEEFVKFLSDEDEEKLHKNTFIEKGYEKGYEQGLIKKTQTIALKMLKQNMNIEQISNITGLTKEEINKLNKE